MPDWPSTLRTVGAGVTWRAVLERTGLAGVWLLRFVLGIALVVFAMSFVGPPPVESVAVSDGESAGAVHDALHNLRAETYRVTLEAERTVGTGDPDPFFRETRTVDNRGHRYVMERATGGTIGAEGAGPERRYGTVTTGFGLPESESGSGEGEADWRREATRRYHPTVNTFGSVGRLQDAPGTVVTNTTETYTIRIEDRDAVTAVVDLPGHDPRRAAAWNATLTVSIARDTGRVTSAQYRYRQPDRGTVVRGTYEFDYGVLVDVDRPLGTYPPGEEIASRLDLGVRAVYALLGGGRS